MMDPSKTSRTRKYVIRINDRRSFPVLISIKAAVNSKAKWKRHSLIQVLYKKEVSGERTSTDVIQQWRTQVCVVAKVGIDEILHCFYKKYDLNSAHLADRNDSLKRSFSTVDKVEIFSRGIVSIYNGYFSVRILLFIMKHCFV